MHILSVPSPYNNSPANLSFSFKLCVKTLRLKNDYTLAHILCCAQKRPLLTLQYTKLIECSGYMSIIILSRSFCTNLDHIDTHVNNLFSTHAVVSCPGVTLQCIAENCHTKNTKIKFPCKTPCTTWYCLYKPLAHDCLNNHNVGIAIRSNHFCKRQETLIIIIIITTISKFSNLIGPQQP